MDSLPYGFRTQSMFPDESLTGEVFGQEASDLEERWARAATGTDWSVAGFRVRIDATGSYLERVWTNVPGELEIDFLMVRGNTVQPVSVKGTIAHFYTDWQADIDRMKEAKINEFGKARGWMPIISVPQRREDMWRMSNQASANALLREVLT